MEVKTLALILLRAISISGLAISLILISFYHHLCLTHGGLFRDQSTLTLLLLAISLALPAALWFVSSRIVNRSSLSQLKFHSSIDASELAPLILIVIAISLIARGMVEMAVSFISNLALDAVPHAVLVVNLEQSGGFGVRGLTQMVLGSLLLWQVPILSDSLTKLLARRPQ